VGCEFASPKEGGAHDTPAIRETVRLSVAAGTGWRMTAQSYFGQKSANPPPSYVALPDRLAKSHPVFGTSAGQFFQKSLG